MDSILSHPEIVILMPLRDDWISAAELIRRIDGAVTGGIARFHVLLIDDCSLHRCQSQDFAGPYNTIREITVLRLCRNLSHQRAIAIGLAHTHKDIHCEAVAVMDADGEDSAEGFAQLLRRFSDLHGRQVVFAERSRRSESFTFRFFYAAYKSVHFWLTGIKVRVGNFSILPAACLNTLVVMSELWNHYAAAVFRSRLPFTMIPIPRGSRIAGSSSMNFVALVTHGLSAISVFADIVGVRLFILSLVGSFLAGLGIVAVIATKLFTHNAIPGWATYASGTLAVIMMQTFTLATTFTFFMLSNRTNLGFVPVRDYSLFVESVTQIYSSNASTPS